MLKSFYITFQLNRIDFIMVFLLEIFTNGKIDGLLHCIKRQSIKRKMFFKYLKPIELFDFIIFESWEICIVDNFDKFFFLRFFCYGVFVFVFGPHFVNFLCPGFAFLSLFPVYDTLAQNTSLVDNLARSRSNRLRKFGFDDFLFIFDCFFNIFTWHWNFEIFFFSAVEQKHMFLLVPH